jgi:phosphate transport system substrate-binding protein
VKSIQKKWLMGAIACCMTFPGLADTLHGAGSTSAANLVNELAWQYEKSNSQQKIVYQGLGPSDGLKKIKANKVDFAISVVPILPFELKHAHLQQFPLLVLGFVIVLNIPGVKVNELVLNGDVLAGIYRGKIVYWDDSAIQSLNPKLPLPHLSIVAVHRADLAGSTFAFTNYLSKVNLAWLLMMGDGFSVDWPSGVGAIGNEGVAKKIKSVAGSIGYIEFSTAVRSKLVYAEMINRTGSRVAISHASLQSAVNDADFEDAEDYYIFFTNQGGKKSWPLLAGSYVLMRTDMAPVKAQNILKFFSWCFAHAGPTALKIGGIELPPPIVRGIEHQWVSHFSWQPPPAPRVAAGHTDMPGAVHPPGENRP